MMVGINIGKEQLELIAHRTIKDADEDADDAITFDEFKRVWLYWNLALMCSIQPEQYTMARWCWHRKAWNIFHYYFDLNMEYNS